MWLFSGEAEVQRTRYCGIREHASCLLWVIERRKHWKGSRQSLMIQRYRSSEVQCPVSIVCNFVTQALSAIIGSNVFFMKTSTDEYSLLATSGTAILIFVTKFATYAVTTVHGKVHIHFCQQLHICLF